MNHMFKLIWSRDLCMLVPVPEGASSSLRADRSVGRRLRRLAKKLGNVGNSSALVVGLIVLPHSVSALPTDGIATNPSQVTIASSGSEMTVIQSSAKAVINWTGFDIAAGETVTFSQPGASSIALNRVTTGSESKIYGNLNANGQVFLVNNNGVLFAEGANVNVGGLVASALAISDNNFNAENFTFTSSSNNAAHVVNNGSIAASGYVALIGPNVKNEGSVATSNGSAALGAGGTVLMTFLNNNLLSFQVSEAAATSEVSNGGEILATNGLVILSSGPAEQILQTVVNNTGIIQAQGVSVSGGVISLLGGETGAVSATTVALEAAGSININAPINILGSTDSSSLSFHYGQGSETGADAFADVNAPVSLPTTATFTTKQGSTGTIEAYTILDAVGAAGSTTATDLQGMNGDLTANYALGADIDATSTSSWNDNTGFRPIGTEKGDQENFNNRFAGKFNGLGHKISDLTIKMEGIMTNENTNQKGAAIGLFGGTYGAEISNIGLVDSAVSGERYVGALVGWAEDTLISNSYSTGTVAIVPGTDEVQKMDRVVGGLVGQLENGAVQGSYSEANVSGNRAGGLVGVTSGDALVKLSSALGDISGDEQQGGLVGYNTGTSRIEDSSALGDISGDEQQGGLVGSNIGYIVNSHALGDVTSSNGMAGGLIGTHIAGEVTDSYATGNVVSGGDDAGGLVGWLNGTAIIAGSNATGNVEGVNNVGGFVGRIDTTSALTYITNSFSEGNVEGVNKVGGIVGHVRGGSIDNTTASGDITATGDYAGGLVGHYEGFERSNLTNTSAQGHVQGNNYVGGLVGHTSGIEINRVSAQGTASGNGSVGGLVGYLSGDLGNAYSTGEVTGSGDKVGGLVGHADRVDIEYTYATGNVIGKANMVGGLFGEANEAVKIENSYSIGNVSGKNRVGGLAGFARNSNITKTYASGDVTGVEEIGGLAGTSHSTGFSQVYATGEVTATTSTALVGGLIGSALGGSAENAYWDTQTTGQSSSADWTEKYNNTGLTTTQIKSLSTFDGMSEDISAIGGQNTAWRIYEGQSAPLLRGLMSDVTLSEELTRTYDGSTTANLSGVGLNLEVEGVELTSGLFASKDAGTDILIEAGYAKTGDENLSTVLQRYDFNFTGTITPKELNVTGLSVAGRAYNGSDEISLTGDAALSGFIGSETVTISNGTATSGTLSSPNAGAQSVATSISLSDGDEGGLAGNYSVLQPSVSNVIIAKKILTGTVTANNKVYDGSTVAIGTTLDVEGFVDTETVTATVNASTFNNSDVGTATTVTVNGFTIADGTNGGLASNYNLPNRLTASAFVTPKELTATATAYDKVYDGSTAAIGTTLAVEGFVDTETVTATVDSTFNSSNVETATTVTVNGLSLSDGTNGGLASNYSLSTGQLASASITPKELVVTGLSAADRFYNGSNEISLTGDAALSGFIGSETVTISNGTATTGRLSNPNAGTRSVTTSISLLDGDEGGIVGNYFVLQSSVNDVEIYSQIQVPSVKPAEIPVTSSSPLLSNDGTGGTSETGEASQTAASETVSATEKLDLENDTVSDTENGSDETTEIDEAGNNLEESVEDDTINQQAKTDNETELKNTI